MKPFFLWMGVICLVGLGMTFVPGVANTLFGPKGWPPIWHGAVPIWSGLILWAALIGFACYVQKSVQIRSLRWKILALPIAYLALALAVSLGQYFEVLRRMWTYDDLLLGQAVDQPPESVTLVVDLGPGRGECSRLCVELLFEKHVHSVYVQAVLLSSRYDLTHQPPKNERFPPLRYSIEDPERCVAEIETALLGGVNVERWFDSVLRPCIDRRVVKSLPDGLRVYNTLTSPDRPDFSLAELFRAKIGHVTHVNPSGETFVAHWERVEARVWLFPPLWGLYTWRGAFNVADLDVFIAKLPINYGVQTDTAIMLGQILKLSLDGEVQIHLQPRGAQP